MVAIKAIYDLAAAAGVELEADVSGPSDMEFDEEVEVDEVEEDEDAEAFDRAQPAGDASVEPATGDDDPQV